MQNFDTKYATFKWESRKYIIISNVNDKTDIILNKKVVMFTNRKVCVAKILRAAYLLR